ncbi:hypothetical protein GOODEAATRI_014396, partial [Goodea atripinnis]
SHAGLTVVEDPRELFTAACFCSQVYQERALLKQPVASTDAAFAQHPQTKIFTNRSQELSVSLLCLRMPCFFLMISAASAPMVSSMSSGSTLSNQRSSLKQKQ